MHLSIIITFEIILERKQYILISQDNQFDKDAVTIMRIEANFDLLMGCSPTCMIYSEKYFLHM